LQYELHYPRIFFQLFCKPQGLCRRADGAKVYDAPLCLGDYFLRHHQDVAILQADATLFQRLDYDRIELVLWADVASDPDWDYSYRQRQILLLLG
jgi:hypothetical protein